MTLYAIPGSNAVLAAQLALERKGIEFRRVDQIPVLHRVTMRLRGFSGATVPGLVVDRRKIHGSRAILAALDELQPDPPLYPRDPERRRAAEAAMAWGEDVYQETLRLLLPYSLKRRREAIATVLAGSRLPLPPAVITRVSGPTLVVQARINHSTEATVRRRLAELPGLLDHIDALIADGTLNAAEPGAADFMIAPTTRSLMWWDDLRPAIESRPAGEHARRLVPDYPGEIAPVLPQDALEPLRA